MSDGALQTLKFGMAMGMGERFISEMVDVVKRLNGTGMKVIVLGAGVIGVDHSLLPGARGGEVRVLDQRTGRDGDELRQRRGALLA